MALLIHFPCSFSAGHCFQDSEPRMGVLLEARVQEPVQQQHSAAVVPIQEEQISKMINNVNHVIYLHISLPDTPLRKCITLRDLLYRMLSMHSACTCPRVCIAG